MTALCEEAAPVPVRLTMLGTGARNGVPELCCHCRVCSSTSPSSHRTRASALLSFGDSNVLIDCTPDFRAHCLRERITRVSAALLTSSSYSRVFGIDDLRAFSNSKNESSDSLPIYSSKSINSHVRRHFRYIFESTKQVAGGKPKITLSDVSGTFSFLGRSATVVPLTDSTVGFRFRTFAYVPDCTSVPSASLRLLSGADTLILGAGGDIDRVLSAVRPRRAFLTCVSHSQPTSAVTVCADGDVITDLYM